MSTEYKLPFTASEVVQKLGKIDELTKVNDGETNLIDTWSSKKISDTINDAISDIGGGNSADSGDTLTWDGNIIDAYYFENADLGVRMVHCSDAIPTLSDLQNGVSFTLSDGTVNVLDPNDDMSVIVNEDGNIALGLGLVGLIVSTPVEGVEKAGVYLMHADDGYVASLTINGYTGFQKKPDYGVFYIDFVPEFITPSMGLCHSNKTFGELAQAFQSGKLLVSRFFMEDVCACMIPLTMYDEDYFLFSFFLSELTLTVMVVMANNSEYVSGIFTTQTLEDIEYTTARYRASSLHSSETTPTVNGAIAWTYE